MNFTKKKPKYIYNNSNTHDAFSCKMLYKYIFNPYKLLRCIIINPNLKMVLSHVQLFVTLWTVAHQALLSVGFFRQEY